jgi:hypothetical protein
MVCVGEREESGWVCVSSMVSRMEGTGVMIAGVGGRVPAVGSAPLSLFAGAGVPFLALFSPGSGSVGLVLSVRRGGLGRSLSLTYQVVSSSLW